MVAIVVLPLLLLAVLVDGQNFGAGQGALNAPLPFGGPINPEQLPQMLHQPSLKSGEDIEAPFQNGGPVGQQQSNFNLPPPPPPPTNNFNAPNFNQKRPNFNQNFLPNGQQFSSIRRAQPQLTQQQPRLSQQQTPCPQPTWQKIMEDNVKANDSTATLNAIQSGFARTFKNQIFMLDIKGDGYCNVERDGVSCQAAKLSAEAGITLNGLGGTLQFDQSTVLATTCRGVNKNKIRAATAAGHKQGHNAKIQHDHQTESSGRNLETENLHQELESQLNNTGDKRKLARENKKARSSKQKTTDTINVDDDDYENEECANCTSLSSIDQIIHHVAGYLKETQTVVDEQVKNVNDRQKNELIETGTIINTAILGLYVSLQPIYNLSEEPKIFSIILPKMIDGMVAALVEFKELAKDKITKYFDELKWRLVANNNEQAGGISTTRSMIKKLQEILQNVEKKKKGNAKLNNVLMLNINFYINLYNNFYTMLDGQKQLSVINTSPKLLDDWKTLMGTVEFLFQHFQTVKERLLQNNSISLAEAAALTERHEVEEINSDAETQAERQNLEAFLGDDDDASDMEISTNSTDEDCQMVDEELRADQDCQTVEEIRSDQHCQMVEEIRSADSKLLTKQPAAIRHSLTKIGSSSGTKISESPLTKWCTKCDERTKIEATVNQLKYHQNEIHRLNNELSSTHIVPIASSIKTTKAQRINEQKRIQKEITAILNAIGTVIYGFKLAILPMVVQYGTLSSNLKDMTEPVECKLMEYLKITKYRLLADPDIDEAYLNAQTKNLKKFIGNYSSTLKKSKNNKSANKLHNLNVYIHLFNEMHKLLNDFNKSQNFPSNNGGGRVHGQQQQQQTLGNGQKFFVIQRDTNALDGGSPVQFSGMGGSQNTMQPQMAQPQFSQNFASSPPSQPSSFGGSMNQQSFIALQQPQTFVPQQNRMPMPNQQFINRGMAPQFSQRQSAPGTDLPPLMAPPQLAAQNAQEPEASSSAFSSEGVPCPQPVWKEAIEKAIVSNNANASTNTVQKALSLAARGTFIVACAPADRREAFQKKMRLSATGNNYCQVIKNGVWCQAVAMNLGRQGISLGLGRR
uniref:Uncharacterized protein n=1 Tax=Globodera rostochiensis TaxID=31243 RepID=A0A914IEJ5_GLORO